MIKIIAFPRIHISLIGMNHDGYRLNGGIGFSIASPTLEIFFEPSNSVIIVDKRQWGFSTDELDSLTKHINHIVTNQHFNTAFRCVIQDGMVLPHVGFGSNTAIYLSCVEALFIINHREYSKKDVINFSGRGGTSGIGINTYFEGGFVFDAGVLNCDERPLAPSSTFMTKQCDKPLLLKCLKLPMWDLGICVPPIKNKTEDEEKQFFLENCPIDKREVESILYEAVYGVTSAIMENNIKVFCKSINAIQQTKWKYLERSLYGNELLKIEAIIRNAGANCVGMSSLGPMLYFFGEKTDDIIEKIQQNNPHYICFKSSLNNIGRIISND